MQVVIFGGPRSERAVQHPAVDLLPDEGERSGRTSSDVDELHLARVAAGELDHEQRHLVRHRARTGYADRLASELLDVGDVLLRDQQVVHLR